ncbi:FmdB family zinc ribbon protein [Acidobacteriota bacterium]
MPLYEYKCSKCVSVFEVIQKVDAPALKKCLKCGAPVYKIISSSAIQFKGSGWYVTDYAQKDNKKSKSEEPKKIKDAAVKKEAKKSPAASSTK